MRFFSLVLVGLIGVSLTARSILACSCKAPPPPKEAMETMAAVFAGNVLKVETDEKAHQVQVSFDTSRVWKGDVAKTVTVITSGGTCGFGFHEGDSYLVYAYDHGGQFNTNICTRTKVLSHAKEDLDALGEGKAVDGGPGATKPATKPSDQTAGRVKQLQTGIKNFSLAISYMGPQDKPYYNLILHVAPMEILRNDLFHLDVQITETEASKIITHMATEGFLDRAIDLSNGANHQAVLIGPLYSLTTTATSPPERSEFSEPLAWDVSMLKQLDALREILEGEAAKQMNVLLERLAGERKAWEKAGETKKAQGVKEDFVTLNRIPTPEDVLEMRTGDGKNYIAADSGLPESFRNALATAKPIDAGDKSLRTWSYSPNEWGTFKTKEGTYKFTLFLGKRGQLTTPSGDVGMFTFAGPATRP